MKRPWSIVSPKDVPEEEGSYPGSDEELSAGRRIGKAAGLQAIGVWLERLPPGRRTSWPHAHPKEEELVFVLEGSPSAWIDGHLHPLAKGDLVAFPAGTGVAHTILNDSDEEVLLLVAGEATKDDDRVFYPLHPERKETMKPGRFWDDAPRHPLGPHDGTPARRRSAAPPVVEGCSVRPLRAEDAQAFWSLRKRAVREEPGAFAASAEDEEAVPLDEVRRRLEGHSPSSSFVLGAFTDELVGMVGIARDRHSKMAHRAHLWGMYVAPQARGRGIGRLLVARAVEAARAMPVEILRLAVVVGNDAARRLYLEAGFRPWGLEPSALRVDGRDLDEEWMVLRL